MPHFRKSLAADLETKVEVEVNGSETTCNKLSPHPRRRLMSTLGERGLWWSRRTSDIHPIAEND